MRSSATICLTLPLFFGVPRYSEGYYEASVRLTTGVPIARSDRRIPNSNSEHVQSLAGARCAAAALFAFSSRLLTFVSGAVSPYELP